MKNNLKILLFALFFCVNIYPATSQRYQDDPRYVPVEYWHNKLNEKDGVHVVRVILPKYVTRKYTIGENNSYRQLCKANLGLSASFIDAKTHKRITFYEGSDYHKNLENKQSLETDLFNPDEGLFYDVIRLYSEQKYYDLNGQSILLEERIRNQYKLKPWYKGTEIQIYYMNYVCNGETFKVFLDYHHVPHFSPKAE